MKFPKVLLMLLYRFLLALFLLSSCAAVDVKKQSEFSADNEKLLSRKALVEIQKNYPALQDEEIQNYVSAVGNRILEKNKISSPSYEYTFTVVNVPSINAFTLPAGKIFVTSKLLAFIESEDELAGVIGHEIAHSIFRHTLRKIENQKIVAGEGWLYAGGGVLAGSLLSSLASSAVCGGNQTCSENLRLLSAGLGLTAGLLVQKHSFLANQQSDELDADQVGFELAVRAGYDLPKVNMFQERILSSLNESNKPNSTFILSDAMTAHPPSAERVKKINLLKIKFRDFTGESIPTKAFEKIRFKLQSMGGNNT